ncbi:MAG: hypothetical protein Q9195_005547 [Heterodermia aff. obscurata]
MENLRSLGTSIQDVMIPTFQIYDPLLRTNAAEIRSVKRESFSYGPLERQNIDIYSPPEPSIVHGRRPVLLFEYGDGLVNSHKTLPLFDGLVHANVGAFFALRFGYTVAIADYRLLSHGTRFGEDLALALDWICRNQPGPGASGAIDLFVIGNSTGGVHVSAFLFHEDFAGIRQKVLQGWGTRLRGVVLLSVPFAFGKGVVDGEKGDVLKRYFGDVEARCPLALMRAAYRLQGVPDVVKGGVPVFVLNAELDPVDEYLRPRDEFVKEWFERNDSGGRCLLTVSSMMGQNHFSPVLGLGTGKEVEEAWGHQVGVFCDTARKITPWE